MITKTTTMVMAVTMAIAGCAMEASEPVAQTAQTTAATAALKTGDVTTASPVWYYLGTESCHDFFQRSCNSSFPQSQCPSISAGQPCAAVNTFCDKVLPGNTFFEQYICQ